MDNLLWYHLGKKRGGGGGGSGGSGATKVDVFKEHKITGFASDANYGGAYVSDYVFGVGGAEAFQLLVGENYTVVWDGEEHKVTAQDGSALVPGAVLLGNGSFLHPGLGGNNEPFLFGWTSGGCAFGSVDSTLESHNIRIYQTVFDHSEETSVSLNFTNGDQIVRPSEDGKLLSQVTIEMPEDLRSENILKDKNIGGIVGSLVVGGGDAPKVVVKNITVTNNSGVITLLSADELATIGFAKASKKFALIFPQDTMYAYQSGGYVLLANLIRTPIISNQASSKYTYGATIYGSQSNSGTYQNVQLVTTSPFGTSARTNTMYMADGAIVYDRTNSTYKLTESDSRYGYYTIIAGVTD